MKRVVYPLIATALVTITPFLSTFEKGQDIVHGLFDFSVLALLLIFMLARDKATVARRPLMGGIFAIMVIVAIADLQNILSYKGYMQGNRHSAPNYRLQHCTSTTAILLLSEKKRRTEYST